VAEKEIGTITCQGGAAAAAAAAAATWFESGEKVEVEVLRRL